MAGGIESGDGDDPDLGITLESHVNPLMNKLRRLPIPWISAVRGAAAGVGCSIALAADLVIAGETAYFLQAFARVGLVPDGGSSHLLARGLSRVRAMEMMMLGEKISAHQALEWGLINRVVTEVALDQTVLELATALANGPTRAYALIREMAWSALDSDWDTALRKEREMQRSISKTEDAAEGSRHSWPSGLPGRRSVMSDSFTKGFRFDLKGRTVLVTGASSGIGKRFAEILAESGANVVITARRTELLDQVQCGIEERGGTALALAMDVTDEPSTIAAFDAAEERFGAVDSVVANAGVSISGSTLGLSAEDFDRTIAVNLRGTFLTAREGARRLIKKNSAERGHGRIVLVSSTTAFDPPPSSGPYAASKAAVAQLGRTMAKDWAHKGINVNVIAPGYFLTEMTDDLWAAAKGIKLLAGFSRKRLMDLNALDPMLLYLCSDASAQVTGSIFTIDDGQTL